MGRITALYSSHLLPSYERFTRYIRRSDNSFVKNVEDTKISIELGLHFSRDGLFVVQWKPVKVTPLKVNNRFRSTADVGPVFYALYFSNLNSDNVNHLRP